MPIVPAVHTRQPRLADVLESCLGSIRGEDNALGLPAAAHAIVVLVDGLGAANIRACAGHARFLASAMGKRSVIDGVFPATTAVGLGSLCTGADAGEHGLVGYRVFDAAGDRLVNQLSGWDEGMDPLLWQREPTVFERAAAADVPAFAIGPKRYAHSGLTTALLRGAQYVPAKRISDRLEQAKAIIEREPAALIYLYIPELDQIAHARGWLSDRWSRELEDLDAELATFAAGLDRSAGLIVTADHGVIDVLPSRHVLFDTVPELVAGVRRIGGDPRCLYLYLEDGMTADACAEAWRTVEGHRAWVYTRGEAIEAGLYGEVAADVKPRIGDVIIAARAQIAYYDGRIPDDKSREMVGQHGSRTDEERRVPCIRAGAYAH